MNTCVRNIELENLACDIAISSHRTQMRKTGDLYVTHPCSVAVIVENVKESKELSSLIIASYLHDTVEDTNLKIETINNVFGSLVAELVIELTSDKNEIKRIGKTNYLINKMLNMTSWALVIKLADRYHNTLDIQNMSLNFQRKYIKETRQILEQLQQKRKLSQTHLKLIR